MRRNNKVVLLIFLFFIYILVLIKYFAGTDPALLLVFLMPVAIISLFQLRKRKKNVTDFFKDCLWIIIFLVFYFLLYGFNQNTLGTSITSILVYLLYMFILYVYSFNSEYRNIDNCLFAFLLLVIFAVFIPSYIVKQGDLAFGSYYNLMDDSLLTVTTVEAPLLVSILLLLGLYDIFLEKKKLTLINLICVLFSVFLLFLFNRRGFIFSSFFSILFYYFINKLKLHRIIYFLFLALVLPMFWEIVSLLIVAVTRNEFISSFLVRNDSEEIISATGRTIGWTNILTLFFSFDSRYLFGYYGKQPERLFVSTEEAGRYEHAHNTVLQLFLDSGYFIVAVFIFVLYAAFRNYIKVRKRGIPESNNFYFLLLIFMLFLSSTETLIKGFQFSSFIYLYIIIGMSLYVFNLNRQAVS